MGEDEFGGDSKKVHIKRKAGKKADKKIKRNMYKKDRLPSRKIQKLLPFKMLKRLREV